MLLGISINDKETDVNYIVSKISGLRIFEDEDEKMNLTLKDINGEILLISQFTLYGDVRRGKRPSFTNAMSGDLAKELYEKVVSGLRTEGFKVETGEFGADMKVSLLNDGPVTIVIDTKNKE